MSSRAATLTGKNLVVTAGAGTGKTALIVERALNLIGSGLPIDSLAAITFTEKAAAGLRERLASGLDELRQLSSENRTPHEESDRGTEARRSWAWLRGEARVPSKDIEARALAALTGLDSATVSTIHAFCAEILRRYPREAGVDPSFVVDEGRGFDTLFEEEWERFLLEEFAATSPRVEFWRKTLLIPGVVGAVRSLALELASFGIPGSAISPVPGYIAASGPALFGEEGVVVRKEIVSLQARELKMPPGMKAFLAAADRLLNAFLKSGLEEMALVMSPDDLEALLAKSPSPGAKLTDVERDEVEAIAKRAKRLLRSLSRIDEPMIAILFEAAAPLAVRARERLLASGLASFDALLRLARDLLAGDVAVRRQLASRYRTILVDEFQDTDPLQYEILFFLAEEEGSAAKDAYEARLAPGRLFIVGDPKQSIYRFRGADMEAYQRAVTRVLECGGEQLTLSVSYRSPSAILDPINTIFSRWIGPRSPEEEAFEPRYEPITSARAPGGAPGPRVEIWSVASDGNVFERRRAEAEAIARWIALGISSPAVTGEPLCYKHVALLFRALTNVPLYAQALRRAGIPFIVEGGRDFYEKQEVSDLIALLRAAANPNDAASVLAVMRSLLGGVPDAELARYAAENGRLDRPAPGEADGAKFPDIHRTLAILAGIRQRMIGTPPDEIIRSVIADTPLALLHASAFEGAQRVSNLRKLVARAGDLARRGLSLEETLRYIEEEFKEGRTEGESPLADETVDAVRILSVHKAKGLEYPVVIIPDIGRRPPPNAGGNETSAAWVRHRSGSFLGACVEGGGTNLAWAWNSRALKLHEAAEEKRVFYVACTRARERLVLVNSDHEKQAAPWRDALVALGYQASGAFPEPGSLAQASVEHRIVEPRRQDAATEVSSIDPIWATVARAFDDVAGTIGESAYPLLKRPTGEHEARESIDRDETTEPRHVPRGPRGSGAAAARLAGSAIHAALEQWDFRDAVRLAADGRAAAKILSEEEGGLMKETLAETDQIVKSFLASPLPARLAAVTILGREVPVLLSDPGGFAWSGYCDLIYRDTDGVVVVADYKTDRVADDATMAGLVARYRPQLTVYLDALARALPGQTIRAEILFVRNGQTSFFFQTPASSNQV